MFGTQIALYILEQFPTLQNVTMLVYSLRSTATFVLLFIMFELLFTIVPTKRLKFRKQVPGAVFAALLWVLVTKLFSIYIDYYASKQYMYGSLTTVIMIMFWLYMVIYILFLGAQLNEYLHQCRKRNLMAAIEEYREDEPDAVEEFEENLDSDDLGEDSYEDEDYNAEDYDDEDYEEFPKKKKGIFKSLKKVPDEEL